MASRIFQCAFGRAITDTLHSRPIPTQWTFFTSFRNLQTLSILPAQAFSLPVATHHPLAQTFPFNTINTYPSRPKIFQSLLTKSWSTNSYTSRSRLFSSFSRVQSPRHTPNPKRRSQFFQSLDLIPRDTLFWGIIGLNGTVFAMWYLAGLQLKSGNNSAYIWMKQNFTNSWENVSSLRIWTLLTACFSHESVSHILFNGFTFYFMAKPVLSILGSRNFLFLYLGGGMFANIASTAWSNLAKGRDVGSHGASAAIYAVVSFLACVAPKLTFQLYGIIPVPAWLVVIGIFTYDTYSAVSDKRRSTDTAGHVAGLIAGAGYFVGRLFRVF